MAVISHTVTADSKGGSYTVSRWDSTLCLGPLLHHTPVCPFSSLSVDDPEASHLLHGWKNFPQTGVQLCPGPCVLSSGSLSPNMHTMSSRDCFLLTGTPHNAGVVILPQRLHPLSPCPPYHTLPSCPSFAGWTWKCTPTSVSTITVLLL